MWVAIVTRAGPASDLLIGGEHSRRELATIEIRRVCDDRQDILGAQNATHPPAPSKAGFAIAGTELIRRAAGDRCIKIRLPVLPARAQSRHMCTRMTICQSHDLFMSALAKQVLSIFEGDDGSIAFPTEQKITWP